MSSSIFARLNPTEIELLYQSWNNDPTSVDPVWAAYFEGYALGSGKEAAPSRPTSRLPFVPVETVQEIVSADPSTYFRRNGHHFADINPLYPISREERLASLPEGICADAETICRLFDLYCDKTGYEYTHIDSPEIVNWIKARIESSDQEVLNTPEKRISALEKLLQSEQFEEFLGKKFLGEKRFSLEGGEGLIVLLQSILDNCPANEISHVELGMAHRGRLNVLANILHKSLRNIFYEFTPDYMPDNPEGGSDVKYHLGYATTLTFPDGQSLDVTLSANPSHLEAVDPIVEGRARAVQHEIGDNARKKVLPILIHGDAAFAGQGLVSEVLNLSQLRGYKTGGTIHIIVNNQIGFTTDPGEARSSRYATDMAKMVQAPILHVNGESPEALVKAALFALDFRQKFAFDIVLDIYCYRKLGHNETDQSSFTNPMLAATIANHPGAVASYSRELIERGDLTEAGFKEIADRQWQAMEEQLQQLSAMSVHSIMPPLSSTRGHGVLPYSHDIINTGITPNMYRFVGEGITRLPEGFHLHPTLEKRVFARRKAAFENGTPLDWGMGEALAWGSLMMEGTPVRISGQDCQRGTFSHRHAVVHDQETGAIHIPLEHLSPDQAPFRIFNSSLSEASILGFEYGYSLGSPDTLTMWEAQFGDFANGAQVIIDQFIAAAEAKWRQGSSITLLLPHGYEGAGSEHSSARIERYLQLCAQRNMQILNLTTPAQLFHALRRQIKQKAAKPMVIFTPKSLLSLPDAVSPMKDFLSPSGFQEILPDPESPTPRECRRVILCSGKVFYDLMNYRREHGITDTLIVRIEQLYPIYDELLTYTLAPYEHIRDYCWCQEEPENMGPWNHIRPRLNRILSASFRYAGRLAMACPAEGAKSLHKAAQKRLLSSAFNTRETL